MRAAGKHFPDSPEGVESLFCSRREFNIRNGTVSRTGAHSAEAVRLENRALHVWLCYHSRRE
jgi:hypothetical protein